MKAIKWRPAPFGCEPLETRLQFAGDLSFDTSFSPDLQSALDHAITAQGHTTAHLESSGLGLVLELTGNAGTLLSVAADGIPATIAGVKVFEASQFSINGTRTLAFLNLTDVAQAKVAGVHVQYSLYANNVGELQADARQFPVTVTGDRPTIFYSPSFEHVTLLDSAADLTLATPTKAGDLSLVLLGSNAHVHLAFAVGALTVYGGTATQVDHTNFAQDYTPPAMWVPAPVDNHAPPDTAAPPAVPPLTSPGTGAPPPAASKPPAADSLPPPTPLPDPSPTAPPVASVPPVNVVVPPVNAAPPPIEAAPFSFHVAPLPIEAASFSFNVAPPPVEVAPPVRSSATGAATIPDLLRGLIYLASLQLISFDDHTQAHLSYLLDRAAAGAADAVTLNANPVALDAFDHRRGTEPFPHDTPAGKRPASMEVSLRLPSVVPTIRGAASRNPPPVLPPLAVARGGGSVTGDAPPAAGRVVGPPAVPRGSDAADDAGRSAQLFAGGALPPVLATWAVPTVPATPALRAFGSLLAERLQAEWTPGERTAVLISESRPAGSAPGG